MYMFSANSHSERLYRATIRGCVGQSRPHRYLGCSRAGDTITMRDTGIEWPEQNGLPSFGNLGALVPLPLLWVGGAPYLKVG